MKSANETFTRNTIFLTVCALIITLLALVFQNELALFLGASEVTLPYVHDYLGVLIWFTFFFIVSYSMEVLVKTDGFPKLATAAVTVGAVTNIVMDYVLVVQVGMGIRGAAIATGLSQVLTFTVFTIHFLGKRGTIHWCKTTLDLSVYKRIIPIGTADFITELSAGTIIFLFNHAILKHIGDNGVVTYTVITYIYNIVMMTFTGIATGQLLSRAQGGKDLPIILALCPVLHVCDVIAGAGNLSVYDAGACLDFYRCIKNRAVCLYCSCLSHLFSVLSGYRLQYRVQWLFCGCGEKRLFLYHIAAARLCADCGIYMAYGRAVSGGRYLVCNACV